MLHGKHLIAGEWVKGVERFQSSPATGPKHHFAIGTTDLVDRACKAAEKAFWSFAYSSRATRAEFLNQIAEEIDKLGDLITEIGSKETGLPEARLEGERGRTTGQLRLFANHIMKGDYLDRRHDPALPERQPLPRPDLRMIQRPIGPVAIFGASNFPLAFSTAGGDTAAALAAGCPVVVKGHSAHPGTAELVGQAIDNAIKFCSINPGVFSLIQGNVSSVGRTLVQHPCIQAVSFTGSLSGGRALFDLCAARPEPIPFFGELGSINPMFLMPGALTTRMDSIAKGWVQSLTMGAGQFCTNPGIVVMIDGDHANAFAKVASVALQGVTSQTMLTDNIAASYRSGRDRIKNTSRVDELLLTACDGRNTTPNLFRTTGENWLANEDLSEEVFGPLGMIVTVQDIEEMLIIARNLRGQLTCAIHLEENDMDDAARLTPIIERKAGRILANGFPTGVEVCDAMVHGGPYPATTNFGASSVGTLSIRRFLRPVCYQNLPMALLPTNL